MARRVDSATGTLSGSRMVSSSRCGSGSRGRRKASATIGSAPQSTIFTTPATADASGSGLAPRCRDLLTSARLWLRSPTLILTA